MKGVVFFNDNMSENYCQECGVKISDNKIQECPACGSKCFSVRVQEIKTPFEVHEKKELSEFNDKLFIGVVSMYVILLLAVIGFATNDVVSNMSWNFLVVLIVTFFIILFIKKG